MWPGSVSACLQALTEPRPEGSLHGPRRAAKADEDAKWRLRRINNLDRVFDRVSFEWPLFGTLLGVREDKGAEFLHLVTLWRSTNEEIHPYEETPETGAPASAEALALR